MKTDWNIIINNSPGFEGSLILRETNEEGGIINELSLQNDRCRNLYNLLMDWFGDGERLRPAFGR